MPSPSRALLRPGFLLALALCALFPLGWDALLPHHEGVPIAVTLTPFEPALGVPLPAWRIEAQVVSRVVDGVNAQLVYDFPLERAGRYTLYGISSFDEVAPLALSVNDRPIAAMAFARDTGSRLSDFERRRIATGVRLRRGRNHVTLEGAWVLQRRFALELQREAPLPPLRYLGLFAAAALALLLRVAVLRHASRWSPSPGRQLAASAACFLLFLLAPLAVAALHGVRGFADLDQADRRKRVRLAELEAYLASDDYARTRGAYRVAVLGDSTHFWPLPKRQRMLPTLRSALAERGAGDIAVYGISAGAFSGYDFYLLLNRLVDDPPDLVVAPVNLRSFSPQWNALLDHDFPRIEAYLRLSELPRALGLSVGTRMLRWDTLLLVHLDLWLFDGDLGAFLRGLGRWLHAERDRILADLAPPGEAAAGPASASAWPQQVTPDNPTLQPFRLLNSLAARHGIAVLYYTVQANERAQAAHGVDLSLRRNYALIGREIGRAPGVEFLDLSASNPPWMFSDEHEHLSREGIRAVAGRLADAIVAHRRAAP